ncbi:transcription factor HIVEP3 isoform X1 [Ictalurus furcatus]|uniref:transcription factor HIVEP3 isoform X1 n=1 Tax=Ictalurus furcatus TaxID=66913 RepID=UPI0023504C6E|nr:transcription factor HIVEP3 isoform X1 [Ictalurus furcatus]XP_053488559.1 transcription factor HIVEP3 isoform X1 [Ictalurus furcatus]XP_053488574.1 transcription factor HIVEP3 isoform X1 [Ictalurus furcatus]XP_053488584.1 transcription factor HIVEP3 isoform X1 [Ictalurus furcatus]XP_053488593.1 transcription factor HIVEP3 isoform X1 [Ictalurus furcatus]
MEAEHTWPSDGEQSGGQQQALSESPGGRFPQIQEQATSLPIHGSHGRHKKRQPKRRDLLQRQQQQQSQMGEAWQLQDVPGPSGGSYSSSSLESTTPVPHLQSIPSCPSQELQEGTTSRRERKPQRPGKYVCSYCGRPCAKPSVLQKHIRSHTGERPYPCVPCSFSFKTKSNLYKHRKSHAHRIKAGLASRREEYSFSRVESGTVGDEQGEATEADSTESEDETGQHQPSTSQDRPALKKSSKFEISFSEEGPRTEDSQAIKQRLAMRLSERKRAPMESPDESPSSSLGPGSKGSTESGYFSSYGSAELSQVSPPNANVKSYAEIILGKYGRLGQQQRIPHQHPQSSSSSSSLGHEEKSIPFTVPKTQVIEHITKLITINEAVVDTSEIDSVKPRRSSLSRRSSIESAKFSSPKDPKEDFPGTTGQIIVSGYATDAQHSQLIEGTLSSHCPSGVLLRSQSVPSSSGKDDPASSSSHRFRLSQSFDEQQAASVELRVGHHHRMLRRQPAIEMPVGADLTAEAVSSVSIESGWKQQKGIGLSECEICGTHLKQDNYEAHRVSCMNKSTQDHQSEKKVSAEQEDHRQIMHYKFKAMAMAIRKRRKEESLEEDPPSPGPAAVSFSNPLTTSAIENKDDFQGFSDTVPQIEPEKTGPYKEISVIQHTSSFEKQESMSIEIQESELEHKQSQEPKQTSTSRLVRQPKIQVPEILVTKEPDPEMISLPASTYIPRELEKEEFQWPQRSQSLAQLPAEKLPPKKKRLRLAEAPQSSGESSFESVSLPRSPSQESNVSHTSSRSTSFDETGKIDPEMQAGTWSSQGSHMLTVPGGHQHYLREMHRSASEQAPASPPHPAQIVETRSKSFDCGSLSPRPTSSSWKERRKCLLVKHATLEKPDQEESSSSIHQSYPGHTALTVGEHRASSTSRFSPETLGKTLQLFQTPLPLPTTVYPLTNPTGLLPVTTISEVLSSHMLQQALIQTVPSSFDPRQLHLAEHLGLPVQPFPTLLSLQYPTSSLIIQDPLASPVGESSSSFPFTHRRGSPHHHLVTQHQPRPIIATCLEQLRPVVSLVVPVRLQTNIPTYASAMYTTISQILATTRSQQPICCTAMVIMEKLEGTKLQRSYLSLPTPDFKTCIPLSLPLEFRAETASDDSCGPLCAGGNKRMLSPAGSLELSLEAQRQQKRIKEEEAEESGEESKHCEKFLEENQGTNKGGLRNTKGVEVVVEKEQEQEGKKKEFVLNKPEISQVQTGLKKEERQEEVHRCISVVETPGRSTDTTDPIYSSLHTSTSVSWCYLNYTKPNPSAHTNPQTSVYSSWSVSMYNPNLPGLSTKIVLSLLRSKQMYSSEVYTMAATTLPLTTDKLVDNQTPRVSEVHAETLSTPVKEKEEPLTKRVEKDLRSTEETSTTSKHSEPLRVCIFEGGYKSNEEYVYVRGRGRGKYVCGECGIRCKKPSMLKKHIRTHTDIRPYVCKHCNFAFKTKGNLTKHMKSKAHGKKCLEKGVSESSVDELETEEPGTSEGQVYESEDQEEHQFSDIEDSEDEDGEDNEEEEEELSSHEDTPSSCSTDTHQSDSGPGSQTGPTSLTVSEREEREKQISPVQPWRRGQAVSPDSKRALFSSKAREHTPQAFSPASEGSPLQSVSPRLDLSSPCRHLSPSPERGPSPLTASPLRSFSPLRPLSPGRYRSSRARLSPTPFRTQHRAHSSPGHFHWEPSTKSRESQQERPSTPSTAQASQRLSSPHASLLPSALHFPHNDPPTHVPIPSRTIDHMFSHLPLHSRQQARIPYHMIPIGGIQMVQLRPRSCPKLERASSSTQSPSSPKEEFTFSLSKSSWSTSWNLRSETNQSVSGTQSLEWEIRPLGLHSPAPSYTTAKSYPLYDSGKQKKKDSKQYGSSWPSKTHSIVPQTSQEEGQDTIERHKRSSDVSEKASSLLRKSEQSEPEEPKEGQSKNDPTSEETAEEKSVYSDQSQDSNPDST